MSWPKGIQSDPKIRSQFHHVIDIAPTIYEVLGITPPNVVNGYEQMSIDGISLAYTFREPLANSRRTRQFFDNNGSRALYKDGWMAAAFGPFIPWNGPASVSRIAHWDSATDDWALYNLTEDFSQSNNLAAKYPERLAAMRKEFLEVAIENKDLPIGAGLWLRTRPQDGKAPPYRAWTFNTNTRRMPEYSAPGLGRQSNTVEVELAVPEKANGVLYALGGSSGGVSLYMENGHLVYVYNMLIIEEYRARSPVAIAPGHHQIKVITEIARPGGAGTVNIFVDGSKVASATLARTVPGLFTASETFDVGVDLGSMVASDHHEKRPFEFNGTIRSVKVSLD